MIMRKVGILEAWDVAWDEGAGPMGTHVQSLEKNSGICTLLEFLTNTQVE